MFVERLRAGARVALLVLAVALPFEMVDPIARPGPLQLSSVELFLYLALALWGVAFAGGWVADRRSLGRMLRELPAVHRAVLGFAVVVFVSAAAAPSPRGPGLKFALRSAGGMLLFAAAADLLRAPGAAARTVRALVAGGVAAALLAVAEQHVAGVPGLLHPFHQQRFEALGIPRASGPFQYPNIAAMYLEAIVPLAVAWGTAQTAGSPGGDRAAFRFWVAATALATFVLLDGVLVTASRAGLVGALAAVAVIAGRGLRFPGHGRQAWGAITAAVLIAVLASGSALSGRFQFWHDGDWYRSTITQGGGPDGRLPPALATSSTATEIIDVRNGGALPWLRESPAPVALSYHWLDADTGSMATFDGVRTLFPEDIYAGGGARVAATVRAPSRPGRYILWWDLVHEHTTWFSERGDAGLREAVLVQSGGAARGVTASGPPLPPLVERLALPRRTLWLAALRIFRTRPLLGIGPDNFRHRYGAYLGLAPKDIDERLHANSLYFELLADLGALGVVAFGLLVLALFRTARHIAAATSSDGILALGVAAALGTYLLHGALDYFLEFTPTYALFWLLAGMIVAMDRSREISA